MAWPMYSSDLSEGIDMSVADALLCGKELRAREREGKRGAGCEGEGEGEGEGESGREKEGWGGRRRETLVTGLT